MLVDWLLYVVEDKECVIGDSGPVLYTGEVDYDGKLCGYGCFYPKEKSGF